MLVASLERVAGLMEASDENAAPILHAGAVAGPE
jgi:hypothetical protein